MRILYGTTNQAKLDSMKPIAEELGFELIGLKELGKPVPKVDESGRNPLENTELKASAHGGCLCGRYRNAIYLVMDEDTSFWSMDESIATESFLLTDVAHEKQVPGFPLDSLSKDIGTGEYYYDMPERVLCDSTGQGIRRFFEEAFKSYQAKKR